MRAGHPVSGVNQGLGRFPSRSQACQSTQGPAPCSPGAAANVIQLLLNKMCRATAPLCVKGQGHAREPSQEEGTATQQSLLALPTEVLSHHYRVLAEAHGEILGSRDIRLPEGCRLGTPAVRGPTSAISSITELSPPCCTHRPPPIHLYNSAVLTKIAAKLK